MAAIKVIAIDVGWSGGVAFLDQLGNVAVEKCPPTIYEIMDYLTFLETTRDVVCYLEKVGCMPRDGVKAVWRFSENATALKCALYNARISVIEVPPKAWQKQLGVLPKEKKDRKNKIKEIVQRRYPHIKATLWNADALAILMTQTQQ